MHRGGRGRWVQFQIRTHPHTPNARAVRTPAATTGEKRFSISPGNGAPDSGFRNATGLPTRQNLASSLRAWRTHRGGRSQNAKRRAAPRHGSRIFRRAASRRVAGRDSGAGTRSVWLMAGHVYSQKVGRSAGKGSVLTPSSVCPSQKGAGIACGKRSGSSIGACRRNRDNTQPNDAGREEWITAAGNRDLQPKGSIRAVIHHEG